MNKDRPRILVVEDDPDQQFLYEQLLGREGFEVLAASTAEEARGQLEAMIPAALVLDLSIEGPAGFPFLTHLRSWNPTRTIPVVIVSGTNFDSGRTQEPHPHWDAFLEKPTSYADLAQLLWKLIG